MCLDALAKGAGTNDEFASRVHSAFAEAAKADGQIILFVDQLHQYAGERATTVASTAVQAAIEVSHVRVIGGSSPEAYASHIAADPKVAKLFESISIDRIGNAAADSTAVNAKKKSPINEEFEGEKISPDVRDLMQKVGPNGRLDAILQVNDVNSGEVSSLLRRNGVTVDARMARSQQRYSTPLRTRRRLA